jgi:hypothetical protein
LRSTARHGVPHRRRRREMGGLGPDLAQGGAGLPQPQRGCPCGSHAGLLAPRPCRQRGRVRSHPRSCGRQSERATGTRPAASRDVLRGLEPKVGFEPTTVGLRNRCSTPELLRRARGRMIPATPRTRHRERRRGRGAARLYGRLRRPVRRRLSGAARVHRIGHSSPDLESRCGVSNLPVRLTPERDPKAFPGCSLDQCARHVTPQRGVRCRLTDVRDARRPWRSAASGNADGIWQGRASDRTNATLVRHFQY